MAKKKLQARTPTSRRWVILVAAAVVILAGAGIYLVSRGRRPWAAAAPADSESKAVAQTALPKKLILPAIPRRPRPQALPPEQFNDPVIRKSYEVARDNPALLEQLPCYCGCYANPGHTNNLDCFVDKHGET